MTLNEKDREAKSTRETKENPGSTQEARFTQMSAMSMVLGEPVL